MNKLEQLRKFTTVVADTGEFEAIAKYKPQDATTNPTLVLTAVQLPPYRPLMDRALKDAKGKAKTRDEQLSLALNLLLVNFGVEILKLIPGRVSTEVDARVSFDVEGSLAKAHQIIQLYEQSGIPRERILIKLASTWEGMRAAQQLEKEGIHCNMTLMFSLVQAAAAADAKATLISPFVGRILDWYKKAEGVTSYPADQDPGVLSVTEIYHYLKKFDFKTEVMGASFRNKEEILELAGCDLLTISPKLMEELTLTEGDVTRKLSVEQAKASKADKLQVDEKEFRYLLNNQAMATEKLSEGIRVFAQDVIKLEKLVAASI